MSCKIFLIFLISILSSLWLMSCTPVAKSTTDPESTVEEVSAFSISGQVTYDWIPAKNSLTEGGDRLDYSAKAARPVRRAVVQAVNSIGSVVASVSTNDLGQYTLSNLTNPVVIRVLAKSTETSYVVDSTAPNNCSGASWDVRVINNYTNNSASNSDPTLRPQYAVTTTSTYRSSDSAVNLHAETSYSSGYTSRAGAPFALLDTIISEIELVCQSENNIQLPRLYVNWSANNTPSSGNLYQGQTTTSFYWTENYTGESSAANLYILGKENVDTDEYDDHIVAHEFGHFLEGKLYRSDSIGNSHTLYDSLDLRVAFGEGFGNAIAAMTFNDPVYVDTSGSGQSSGFNFSAATTPVGDDRGIYSEFAVHNFLWNLYDARDGTSNSGSYDRIHNVLKNYQKTTTAFTSVLSFAGYYAANYNITADGIGTLFSNTFDLSINSVCTGTCPASSTFTADLFDSDNDLGSAYGTGGSAPKKYRQTSGTQYASGFWRQYYPIVNGSNSDANHMQVVSGGYSSTYNDNKYGARRWYKYVVPSNTTTLNFKVNAGNCTSDTLDMYVYYAGGLYALDVTTTGATAGCPISSSYTGQNLSVASGTVLLVEVISNTTTTTSYTLTVTP